MNKLRVAMVSYLNALPFYHGIENLISDKIKLYLENPAVCATMFFDKKVDIALLPVGALIDKKDYIVFSDYCIGSNGDVKTVCLFSDVNLDEINIIYLDEHSKTSVLLTKLLMFEKGFKNIIYKFVDTEGLILKKGEAKLMIGDKVFRSKKEYVNIWDLSSMWKEVTGLPFVFAVWVMRPGITKVKIDEFEYALKAGIQKIDFIISEMNLDINLENYFKKNISYLLDAKKRQALELFYNKLIKNSIK